MAGSIQDTITANLPALDRPGVLSVRPGWEVTRGWLTGRSAVVVTVEHKHRHVPDADRLPEDVDGVRVDVRQASARKREAVQDPSAFARQLRLTPDVGAVPRFDWEIRPGGRQVGDPSGDDALARLTATKQQLPYSAPTGVQLAPITAPMTLRLAASPDAGWPVLSAFLGGVESSLTVGLYDFTSAHVLAAVSAALTGKAFRLVLDHPALNPTADQTDDATVADLAASLDGNLTQAWALSRPDVHATAWIFDSAYHIKVAVADSLRTWLSSGNWNNSNQPAIDPVLQGADSPDAVTARTSDRDWHVVVDHPGLAAILQAYLENDLAIAGAHNDAGGGSTTPPPAPTPGLATPPYEEFFGPVEITDTVTITPLLTPDPGVYANAVTALITSATSTLYLQYQYIEAPRGTDPTAQPFTDLLAAIVARQKAGVDVRIICSEYQTTGYLEQLQSLGLDVSTAVRIQNNVHNKGLVVDGRQVLVSSQNWSTAGVLHNRDAGLIIDHPGAAGYYQQIFLHDWATLATAKASDD